MKLRTLTQSLLLTAILPFCLNCTAALPAIHTSGQQFIDSNGREVIFHGLNEMDKQIPYEPSAIGFDERNIQFIEDHGFNIIRLGVFWAAIEPKPGVYNDHYLQNIKQTIQLLAKHHIYTLIDFHQDGYSTSNNYGAGEPKWATLGVGSDYNPGFPISYHGGMKWFGHTIGTQLDDNFSQFWNDTYDPVANNTLQTTYINMVKHTANYFKGMPSVIGYDLMNEPFIGHQWNDPSAMNRFESVTLTNFYNTLTSTIHIIDADKIIFAEPEVSFGTGNNPTTLNHINGNNIAFNFHDYDTANIAQPMKNAQQYQSINQVPLMMTEFGASTSPVRQIIKLTNIADTDHTSWIEWAYTNNPTFKFIKAAGNPQKQGIVFDAKQPLTGSNVNDKRLSALSRIYPEYIAGKHITYSFDTQTYRFMLSYQVGTQSKQTIIRVPTNLLSQCRVQSIGAHPVISSNSLSKTQITLMNTAAPGSTAQVTVQCSPEKA